MPHPGRPKSLDEAKRAEVCALLAAGVSIREAARFVGCDRKTIRNEARRNVEFHRQLQQAKAQAQVDPLRTMHQAAAKNWRAAAWWLERLAPDAFAQPTGSVLGQREANRFANDLFELVERIVVHPVERALLYEKISAALPAAMRRAWDHRQQKHNRHRAIDFLHNPPPIDPTGLPMKGMQFEPPISKTAKPSPPHQPSAVAKKPAPPDGCSSTPEKYDARNSPPPIQTDHKPRPQPSRQGKHSVEFFCP